MTEEDYRDEDLYKICREIATGIEKKGFKLTNSNSSNISNKSYLIEINRKKAIEIAIKITIPGDVVILTGKSHEKSLCRGKTEYPWNEKQVVLDALKKYDRL